ncbi:phospho-N-acetylmuramoyl-pentapeptide-transferase [Rubellimicrobium thermophilum DSM 16684]|uniref:Phospho-N-acetylmuramoyl-pentapeptide-transferase n=1 Tax=Rubellimicrobium thermophilum DSM 16684 TaxID=1123069 RepID=S9SJQ3_9RHOB|nr:phospho-N-acetylmuramoyl-pentapeptide-transferase [Rubellimicrobium thermophilum]EPX86559.1 phospho-N-acetylmuramoyl-pentapeptide-transferase [Rubellimicrobium thermophilum DSM 16684]
MLYWLTLLSDDGGFFNLLRYITFRAGGAFLTALVFGFAFGPTLIGWLRVKQGKGQPIRADGPQSHFSKAGTPTMGGLLIITALVVSTLLWARWDNPHVWMILFVTVSFALLGFADDYAKVTKQTSDGLSGRMRLAIGFLVAAVAGAWAAWVHPDALSNRLALPFVKELTINLGLFFVPFAMLVIVGAANAVNLTDGLDGLAIMPVMIAAATFGAIAYAVGRTDFTEYLGVHFVPGAGEIAIFCAALIGGGRGLPVVQRPACCRLHGRYRFACARRCAGSDRGGHQARDRARHRRRSVRGRGALGHHPGPGLSAHRPARLPDGPHPPPFREEGLGRAADRHPLLDHLADPGDDRAGHAEGALMRIAPGRSPRPAEAKARPVPPHPVPPHARMTSDRDLAP